MAAATMTWLIRPTCMVAKEGDHDAERAWPPLVDCMASQEAQYYLSCEDTLLLADLCKKNVIIFRLVMVLCGTMAMSRIILETCLSG